MSNETNLKHIVEAALLAAGRPLNMDGLLALFLDEEQPDSDELRAVLQELTQDYAERGIEVAEMGSGWRIQVRSRYAPWVSRLWEEKPPRYSRALLETLALICYRQPITRGEIEEIRGVTVSSSIMKTLLEREWVRVVGHRDVPGKPGLYATTKAFLDYFGLRSLEDLPPLADIKDFESFNKELNLTVEDEESPAGPSEAGAGAAEKAGDAGIEAENEAEEIDAGTDMGMDADDGTDVDADEDASPESAAPEGSDDAESAADLATMPPEPSDVTH